MVFRVWISRGAGERPGLAQLNAPPTVGQAIDVLCDNGDQVVGIVESVQPGDGEYSGVISCRDADT